MDHRKSCGNTQRLFLADHNKNSRREFTGNTEPQDILTNLWEVFNIEGQPRSKAEPPLTFKYVFAGYRVLG